MKAGESVEFKWGASLWLIGKNIEEVGDAREKTNFKKLNKVSKLR